MKITDNDAKSRTIADRKTYEAIFVDNFEAEHVNTFWRYRAATLSYFYKSGKMNDYPFPKGIPLTVPLPPHGTLNYESSEASSIAALSQQVSSDHQNMPSGQQTFNGYPLCNVCEEVLEPLFAQSCGLCKLHYHLQCGDKVVIATNYYFELCRSCADKCNGAKTKLHEDVQAAGFE